MAGIRRIYPDGTHRGSTALGSFVAHERGSLRAGYLPRVDAEPIVVAPDGDQAGVSARGTTLVVSNWPMTGTATEVAPLHVHYSDDEAWHVLEGALRFRLRDSEFVAGPGSTVLIPAGLPHTFGNAGPERSRFLIIVPSRLDELISTLHTVDRSEHPEIYRQYDSQLLE